MSTPDLTAFTASLQVAHNAAEAQRVETAKLREELAAEKTKTMEAIIGRLEAEKIAIEERNTALQVTADAAKADAAKAEEARVAAEEAAAAGGSSSGGGSSAVDPTAIAAAVLAAKSADDYTYPRNIALPVFPAFDSSVKFDETDPTYVDGHVRALAWCKVWQAIKEHFEAARDEYAYFLYNAIMKVRLSPIQVKADAEKAGHLFHDAAGGKGDTIINPLVLPKAVRVNATVEREDHANRVQRMVVDTFTEFLNMMIFEKAHDAKHNEYVRWRPAPYSHMCAVREIHATIAAGGGGGVAAVVPFLDGKIPSHTEANNAHYGLYGIAQERAAYFQLLGLDVMHVTLIKALESQLAIVLKKIARTSELKTTVNNQASEIHTAVPAKGLDYDGNTDRDTDPPTKGIGGAKLSYALAAPGTAALRVLDRRFDANGPFSAIMLLVKAGRVGADSTSLESSLQAVADYDTEVRLFFTLPDGTLDRTEMDRAKGLADVLLAVPAVKVVLFDTLTDMIAKHDAMTKDAVKLRQYIMDFF